MRSQCPSIFKIVIVSETRDILFVWLRIARQIVFIIMNMRRHGHVRKEVYIAPQIEE